MAKARTPQPSQDMMDTREVAEYLRLKPRRVYDLVRAQSIPHVRATGKLLFPRDQIDEWLAANANPAKSGGIAPRTTKAPAIVAGSHDPLLEWAARESRSGLAMLPCGSRAGLQRLARGEAVAAAMHWLDEASGEYNVPLVRELIAADDVVVLEWARRSQGLIVAAGNPLNIKAVRDLVKRRVRVAMRQRDAGSHRLLDHLLRGARIDSSRIAWTADAALAENDLATMIADDRADAGLGIEAAAHAAGLAFVPLAVERLDLVAHRRNAFEPALQSLLAFARSPACARYADKLRGYDLSNTGRVVFNA